MLKKSAALFSRRYEFACCFEGIFALRRAAEQSCYHAHLGFLIKMADICIRFFVVN